MTDIEKSENRCVTCFGWQMYKKRIGYCLVHAAVVLGWDGKERNVYPITRYDDACVYWEEKEIKDAQP